MLNPVTELPIPKSDLIRKAREAELRTAPRVPPGQPHPQLFLSFSSTSPNHFLLHFCFHFDTEIDLESHWKTKKNAVFHLLEGISSGSGRSGLAECARCVKASFWRIQARQRTRARARRLKHARHTLKRGRRIQSLRAFRRARAVHLTRLWAKLS